MSPAIKLSAPVPYLPGIKTGPRRASSGLKAWLRQLEQLYGHAALLDMHR